MMSFIQKFTGFGLCQRARALEERIENLVAVVSRGPYG